MTEQPATPAQRFYRPVLVVELHEARPNKVFTEAQTRLVRFLRYYEHGKAIRTACAHCGKKKPTLWTQLCSFKVVDMPKTAVLVLKPAPDARVYPPLTGVCQTHLLAPEMEDAD